MAPLILECSIGVCLPEHMTASCGGEQTPVERQSDSRRSPPFPSPLLPVSRQRGRATEKFIPKTQENKNAYKIRSHLTQVSVPIQEHKTWNVVLRNEGKSLPRPPRCDPAR
ncbi:hypothetical protein E2C01_043953 [Portunus trituberculatus]|uniref:Uncharacterized protein n=1 Tax=Portunus trituberculatus TaxID=210409 RepID=A0A5B7FRM7_PORTR|nr:hypothetical protein [Portunus trituberculatus]